MWRPTNKGIPYYQVTNKFFVHEGFAMLGG
jgi:hypothetical protein